MAWLVFPPLGAKRPTLVHVISGAIDDNDGEQDGVAVGALALLDDLLYIGRHGNDGAEPIDVYNVDSWIVDRQLTVEGLGSWVSGMAASRHDNCLYVSDADHTIIHKVLHVSESRSDSTLLPIDAGDCATVENVFFAGGCGNSVSRL